MTGNGTDGLDELGARIDAARSTSQPKPARRRGSFAGAELAWRMVIDLVAGVGIGFGMGYWLDSLLGSMPLFLILFVFLGLAAGVRVMMRTAREYQEKLVAQSAGQENTPTGAKYYDTPTGAKDDDTPTGAEHDDAPLGAGTQNAPKRR
ncbi:MAG: AtpZ/AtpI family protein [Pseudomonadota bacterium]